MANEIRCPKCKGNNCVKRGRSPTQNRGIQQRYLCKDCKKTFIPDLGFWKMKNTPEKITMSVDMYLSNLSSRKMRNQLKRHFDLKISHITVLDWVRKYVLKVQRYVETLSYDLGEEYFADETLIKRQRHEDRFWACVDWKTRFITGIHYSISGNPVEAKEFLKKSVNKGIPKYIQTDGAPFYPQAFRKLFYSNKRHGLKVQHKVQNYLKTGIHNYKIETVFMKIKDRVQDFRGLKALWSAPILLTGIVLQHNFIEEHTTTRKIPCQLAGLSTNCTNRWVDLIAQSVIG